jgi:DNA repair protein RadA/Sms
VYASVVGGVRLAEPGSDLGICLALASALTTTAVAADLIACAEVGLGGELRQVAQTSRRLAEAARLGFRRAIVPVSAPETPAEAAGMDVVRAESVDEAILVAGLPLRRTPNVAPPEGWDYGRAMREMAPIPDGRGIALDTASLI